MIIAHQRDFGRKLSIRRVMQQIESIDIDFLRRLHMSSLLGGILISPTSGSLVVSVSYTRRKDLANFESRCDEGFFLDYASNSKAYRVFKKISRKIVETCDVEFDESNGSQEEVVGYDHVGDEEVQEALKNMSIGDIKP
jgi:hypothetical protein